MIRQIKSHYPITLFWLLLLVALSWFCVSAVHAFSNDWRAPEMIDYAKDPPFISASVVPNILIVLDNSDSMNSNAYGPETHDGSTVGDAYEGEYPGDVSQLSVAIASGGDDMEQDSSGAVHDDDDSSGLDLGDQLVGLRFQSVGLPAGAVIQSARIDFTAQQSSTGTCDLTITAQDTGDAGEIQTDDSYLSGLPETIASVTWTAEDWNAGDSYSSVDITPLIEELTAKAQWASGNDMLFLIQGSGGCSRVAVSKGVLGNGAVLRISYFGDGEPKRYYGYFNAEWFYTYNATADQFEMLYKKKEFNSDGSWTVTDRSGAEQSLTSTSVFNNSLWDGNWLNWMCMRRIDILRKVLIGGNTQGGRDGTGDQILYGEAYTYSGSIYDLNYYFSKAFNGNSTPVNPYGSNRTYAVQQGRFTVSGTNYQIKIRKESTYESDEFLTYNNGDNLAGVLQQVGDRARWGNMWYNNGDSVDGGRLQNPIGTGMVQLVSALENYAPNTYTPLAETLYTAMRYFSMETSGLPSGYSPNFGSLVEGGYGDPYYMQDTEDRNGNGDTTEYIAVPCAQSYVLMLTDGASTFDTNVPSTIGDYDNDSQESGCNEISTGLFYPTGNTSCEYIYNGTDYLDDVALYAHTQDLRDLDGTQTLTLYTVYAFGDDENARGLLKDASRSGAFEDLPGGTANRPDGDYTSAAEDRMEWDSDSDGIPDTYFEASDGKLMEHQIRTAVDIMSKNASSATAASVVSNSRSGEGATYQSLFYPERTDQNQGSVDWIGQVTALLIDSYGNMREDTNANGALDMVEDYVLSFGTDQDGAPVVDKYYDANGDGTIDSDDDAENDPVQSARPLDDIQYLWSSNDWLIKQVSDPVTQRSAYTDAASNQRYIFTFVDRNGNMVADSGEQMAFQAEEVDWSTIISPDSYYAYIHAYDEPFGTTTDSETVIAERIKRVINYIRGQDQATATVDGVTLPALRSRQIDYDGDNQVETMRLGDIVDSAPTLVAKPAENFHLIYDDLSYLPFLRAHQNRRQVIYVGANDGMLHAFNSGFYDAVDKRFRTRPVDEDGNEITTISNYPLGAELWAYVPYNLLPHLHWLTQADYKHVYYMDLPVRVFDAKIYDGYASDDPVHPNGWATLLVAGMRFGGGMIAADIDKTDGAYDADTDKVMRSAFAIFDITNPEAAPILLAEVTFPELGFTTCHPGVISDRQKDTDHNEWSLIFGSGPASTASNGDIGPNNDALVQGISEQQARLYVLDLKALVASTPQVVMRTGEGGITTTYTDATGQYYLADFEGADASDISKPIAMDWDLDFKTDAVYFGNSFIEDSQWKGKLRRVVINSSDDWDANTTLIDLTTVDGINQPITAAPVAGTDENANRWIFFGTGRFMSTEDKADTNQQAYYGVKEPMDDANTTFTYEAVDFASLVDVSDVEMEDGNFTQFYDLAYHIQSHGVGGWRMDFYDTGERNLSQGALLGGTLAFTTFTPATDICGIGGASRLYAVSYLTGTAFFKPTFGSDDLTDATVLKAIDLGSGMASAPALQIKRGKSVKVITQSGDGGAKDEELNIPLPVHGWRGPWLPDIEECEVPAEEE